MRWPKAPQLLPPVIVLLLLPRTVGAHDLTLERTGPRAFLLRYGHADPSHSGPAQVPYPAQAVQDVRCFASDGTRVPLRVPPGSPVRLAGACSNVAVLFSTGHWTKTPYGEVNRPRTQVSGSVVDSWLSVETIRRVDVWGPWAARPLLGRGLEIVPLGNAPATSVGEKLALLVTLNGRPIAGAAVAYGGSLRGTSDGDGTIRIRIRHTGAQRIRASLERAAAGALPHREVYSAFLQFETM